MTQALYYVILFSIPTMPTRLRSKLLSIALLMIVQMMGPIAIVRSQSSRAIQTTQIAQENSKNEQIKQLVQKLKSTNPVVRSDAAYALGEMGESAKSAIPDLIMLFKDPDARVRSRASHALGSVGEPDRKSVV